MKQIARPRPADRRVHPVPRRRGDEDVEAPTAIVPLLEPRRLDRDVAEGGEPLAGERGRLGARLDGSHRASERGQRARRLPGAAAHLEHRRTRVHAGDGDEFCKQFAGVRRSHAVVELGHVFEHSTEATSIRVVHPTILP